MKVITNSDVSPANLPHHYSVARIYAIYTLVYTLKKHVSARVITVTCTP